MGFRTTSHPIQCGSDVTPPWIVRSNRRQTVSATVPLPPGRPYWLHEQQSRGLRCRVQQANSAILAISHQWFHTAIYAEEDVVADCTAYAVRWRSKAREKKCIASVSACSSSQRGSTAAGGKRKAQDAGGILRRMSAGEAKRRTEVHRAKGWPMRRRWRFLHPRTTRSPRSRSRSTSTDVCCCSSSFPLFFLRGCHRWARSCFVCIACI